MSQARSSAALRRLAPLVFLLFLESGGGDSGAAERLTEPRLTTQPVWRPCRKVLLPGAVIAQAECGPANISRRPVSVAGEACDSMTTNHTEALRTLVSRPDCTDAVIAKLEALAALKKDGRLLSDLAAAVFVRGQRRHHAPDLLRALHTAELAVDAAPDLLEAKFNRALAQESLGLGEASTSWEELQEIDSSSWGTEAGARRKELESAASMETATQWPVNQRRLEDDRTIADAGAVAKLIAPYPAAAQRYVEEEILPRWAEAAQNGRSTEAQRHLERAEIIATQLARESGDHYLLDAVTAVKTSQGDATRALQKGHLALRDARRTERVRPKEAAVHFEQARRSFEEGRSPSAARALVGEAIAQWLSTYDAPKAQAMNAAAEPVVRAKKYGSLITRLEANRANLLVYESRHVDALRHYDASIASAHAMNDRENVANMHARKSGVLRTLGQKDRASHEALVALRYISGAADVPSRHFVLGENAAVALAHGYPGIAIVYQNEAVRLIETALSKPEMEEAEIAFLRTNLSIALRQRAAIQLRLERHEAADADLQNAMRLTTGPSSRFDEIIRNAVQARIHEVEGQRAMTDKKPVRAVEAFTAALELLFPAEHRTFRATLFMQRAEAYGGIGDPKRAELDLRAAVDELRNEERRLLDPRTRGEAEAFWTPYFSRFRETYERLIRLLVEQQKIEEAFHFAEQMRAFEPLTLVLQLQVVPETFRRWTRGGETLPLEAIRMSLPENTFLVEFSVLEDQTYVWIVGRRHFELLKLPVRREVIDGWSASLLRHARERNTPAFTATLEEAHGALLAEPLRKIRKLALPAGLPSLVFVPDRAIHALPLAAFRDADSGRYVIQEFPVSIAANATFYVFSRERDEALAAGDLRPSVLLVGDPAFDRTLDVAYGLEPLTWARDEVKRIGSLYASAAVSLPRESATVPAFLRMAGQSTVVHFAGHAVANPDAPFRSLLLLAPGENHSGALFAEELLTRLSADRTRLIVLSACSSAGGVSIGPEGLAPLVRPLIAAGVPAVVGSLWKVGDHASAELLVAFHRHYRSGQEADRALRLAQLELLEKEGAAGSVLAWAPFQVIGHASSPYE